MAAPAFWFAPRPGVLACALSPCGLLYGAITAWRMARPGFAAGVPVICIGNFVAGGAGKTPMAIFVAQLLLAQGFRPFFLSRGFGGRAGRAAVLVDLARHTSLQVGDEPLLLAQIAPVMVCADRVAGALAAMAAGATVLIMDDGLQNPALAKDLSFAMVDAATGFGNGLCLPAGPLRAPLAKQWQHVAAVVIVGAGPAGEVAGQMASAAGRKVIHASLVPDPAVARHLRGQKVIAFAGIGRPAKFFETLEKIGASIAGRHAFADHHRYGVAEIAALQAEARSKAALLVTTQKDLARSGPWPHAPFPIALPVQLMLDAAVDGLLAQVVPGFRELA